MRNIEEKASSCALGRIFGFEPRTALALINHLGSAEAVFKLDHDALTALLGPHSEARHQINSKAQENAEKEIMALKSQGISYVGWTENTYPSLLKECEDAPIGLYIRSENPIEDLWKSNRSISIVGTRDISPYGREWCERIVRGLHESTDPPLIISGLALGVDICAHKVAISCGLPTIGVMATGPEAVYPHRHLETAREMARTPGCALLTDYPPGTPPLPLHFLRRNRIIAGLAQATILIESRLKGGGMMTSHLAFSYNREVYALPGRVDDIRSQGCNELIRKKIAEPITSVPQLLDSLGMRQTGNRKHQSFNEMLRQRYGCSHTDDKIAAMERFLNAIKASRGITIEELAVSSGLPYQIAMNLCRTLEYDDIIAIDLLQRCSINTKIL